MHERIQLAQKEAEDAPGEVRPKVLPKRQNLSLSQLQEEAKQKTRKVELEKFEYSVENVRRAWENLKALIRNRIPLVYSAIADQSVNIIGDHQTVVVFNNEGALNTFTAFRERAENYFKQVFSLEEFTVEGTVDQSVLSSLDPGTLSTTEFCVYLQQKNEAVKDLFEEFNLKAQ